MNKILLTTIFLSSAISLLAENKPVDTSDSSQDEVTFELAAQDETPQEKSVDLTPKLFGSVRVKYEQSTINGEHRFNVRNSRLGVKGYVSEHMRYAMQIDFNNEGKVSILDSYVAYVANDFEFSLGQQQYHFSRDLDRGPSSSLFSNRSFLAKYLTTYYATSLSGGAISESVSTIGSRDIGALVGYKAPIDFPISATAGIFNGSGANNPEWGNTVNFVGRLVLGAEDGFSVSGSYYYGSTPVTAHVVSLNDVYTTESFKQDIEMYGAALRYATNDFLVEAEFAQRQLYDVEQHTLTTAHVHGYKKFFMPKKCIVDHLAPHLRWDMGNGIEFIDQVNGSLDRYDANRITVALNIGLSNKWIGSEIRLAYEEYIVGSEHADKWVNPLLHDKFTIEFIASF